MPPVLKLGSLDLSPYVGLQKEDGFDPADSDYSEPVFSSSPLREGVQLLGETVGAREMAWPLKLVAASKDALHDLVGQINREHESSVGTMRVEWRDSGATRSTFYEVAAVRFDADFHYWRGQKNRLNGVLRVWVQPYGHTATERLIATAGASPNHLLRMPIASGAISGDVPAKLKVEVTTDTDFATREVALAVLPHASYAPQFSAPSMAILMAGASVRTGQAGAPLGNYLQAPVSALGGEQNVCRLDIPIPSAHLGRNRVIAFARTAFARHANVRAYDSGPNPLGPRATVIDTGDGWQALDLGVLSIARPHPQSIILNANAAASSGYSASPALHISDVVLLPEEQTVLAVEPAAGGTAGFRWSFDGIEETSSLLTQSGSFAKDVTAHQRGAVPRLPVGTRNIVALAMEVSSTSRLADDAMSAEVRCRELFSFAR